MLGEICTDSEPKSINHYITYSIITSQPELSYTSVLSTVRCFAVTSGEQEGSTFVEWTGNFSSDADAGKLCPFLTSRSPGLPPSQNGTDRGEMQVPSRTPSSSVARPSPTWPRLLPSSKRVQRVFTREAEGI